jgi:iron complex outermembrane receptor protein
VEGYLVTKSKTNLFKETALGSCAAIALLYGLPASAQSSGDPANPVDTVQVSGSDDAQAATSPDIVVTGTLLRGRGETASPVTVLTAETLERANITTINDAIRSVSADGAGSISTGFRTGFSAGGAAVSLRGLGASSTVILIDGLRSANFPLNDDGHIAYVDLNSIPFSIVDRVDVLKDGASATYGADAIGGVVNIVTKKHFTGLDATVQGGTTEHGDGSRYRASLTAGVGDYAASGWNFYLNGEFQHDGVIRNHDRGFPYNTLDLRPIGGLDKNTADSSLTTPTPDAIVTRVSQGDLNNPLSGGAAAATNQYQLLNSSACANGTYTVSSGSVQGTGCKHNLPDEFFEIQPLQQRYSVNGRLSVRLSDAVEAYATGSYSRDRVEIFNASPAGVRQTQPYGASPSLASSNPGIVLPVYICSSGVNCATAADRRLNPNNPYASAYAADPANGAARIYYLFGDLPFGSIRTNKVLRATAGVNGHFGGGWNFRVEGMAAKDDLALEQYGWLNIAGLLKAINTGSYNFVNPALNSQAVRDQISPTIRTPSYSSNVSLDASLSKSFFTLPGGPVNVAIGGQVRRETLVNRNQNADLATYGLSTSSAFGRHTVAAGFFEIDMPVLRQLDLNVSGRYDHYSEGFGHFSPKVGFKFTPIPPFALRGTYSEGFRAPTFAENNPQSQFAGFSPYSPAGAFVTSHGGASNPYVNSYNIGSGLVGNANLKPEVSRSVTFGAIFQPARWFSFTVDYYNIKKSNLIVAGPLASQAIDAYYRVAGNTYPTAAAAAAAGCAAASAVGAGYSCNVVDAADPLAPNALPRLLILNQPFVNASYEVSSGLDIQATATIPLGTAARFISRLDVTDVFRLDLNNNGELQRYSGTLGPYDLSSGSGTPKWRGNWQNTIEVGAYSLTATAYYVSHIKEVAADRSTDLSCAANLYKTGDKFCFVRPFIDVDVNAGVRISDKFRFFFNVQNVFNAHAPVAPAAYLSAPNYLASWHYAGLVGRNFSAGANFKF